MLWPRLMIYRDEHATEMHLATIWIDKAATTLGDKKGLEMSMSCDRLSYGWNWVTTD
jgi:hypothetical protein